MVDETAWSNARTDRVRNSESPPIARLRFQTTSIFRMPQPVGRLGNIHIV